MIEASDLAGTWRLESWTTGYSDRDELSMPFGEDPEGLLLYTTDGWMSLSVNRPGSRSRRNGGRSRYLHYAGRYQLVDGDVIHYVSQSLDPQLVGSEQLRHAELDGQTLVLSGKDESDGETRFHSLVWHRAAATKVPGEVEIEDG